MGRAGAVDSPAQVAFGNAKRAAAGIMELLARMEREQALRSASSNDPCPCGSDLKIQAVPPAARLNQQT